MNTKQVEQIQGKIDYYNSLYFASLEKYNGTSADYFSGIIAGLKAAADILGIAYEDRPQARIDAFIEQLSARPKI